MPTWLRSAGCSFCFTHVSPYTVTPSTCEIRVMFKSFPNLSIMRQHTHVIKTSVTEELTVTILKYPHSVSHQRGTQSLYFVAWEYSLESYRATVINGDAIFLIVFKTGPLVKFLIETWIMKLTTLKGHEDMLLNQVIPYLSFAIQYPSIKIIDLIPPMRLSSFHRVHLRVSRGFDFYKWFSKYCSSPHGLIADDHIIHFEIQSQDDHLNKNL